VQSSYFSLNYAIQTRDSEVHLMFFRNFAPTIMRKKKKDIPVVEGFEITGVAAEGKSLGRWNDLVVFVPFGAPGDVIDLKIDRKKHNFAEGIPVIKIS